MAAYSAQQDTWEYPQGSSHSQVFVNTSLDSPYSVNPALVMGGRLDGGSPFSVTSEGACGAEVQQFAYPDAVYGAGAVKDGTYGAASVDYTYQQAPPQAQSPPLFVPELSPSSTASNFSSPSSSTSPYSTIPLPEAHSSPEIYPSSASHLLPSPDILEKCLPQPPATSMGFAYGDSQGSRFAEIQDQFLRQQRQQADNSASQPQQHFLPSPSSRRHRSPAPSSPSSPYARLSTPLSSPYSKYDRPSIANPSPRKASNRLSLPTPARYDLSPSMAAGYRLATQMGTLGGNERPVAPATDEAMEQLMLEIGTILGPDVMSSLDQPAPSSAPSPLPMPMSLPRRQPELRTERRRPPPAPLNIRAPPLDHSNDYPRRDDWTLFESSEPQHAQASYSYPASAPAWQTDFQHAPPAFEQYPESRYPQQYPLPSSEADIHSRTSYYRPTSAHPSSSFSRPRSAPSVDASTGPYQNLLHRPVPTSPASHAQYGAHYPSVMAQGSEQSYHSAVPASPLRYTTPAPLSYQKSPIKSPIKAAPVRAPRKRANSARGAQPAKAAMFINYGASDAKKLLSGVAPSGSSKRKREDEEAEALRRKEEAAAAVKASA
ncbi:hypothetical protein P7C70_g3693, partial [Phenoliferia sp. Uapishka_3]